jgi:hypothetical protein
VIHSAQYKDAAQLRNRKVLVIGGGNTGCDLAVEAAQQAAMVWHSTRRGYWYAPKYLFGRPADQVNARLLRWRPAAAPAAVALSPDARDDDRDLTRYGLPAPDHRPYESHPIVNSQLPYYLGPRPDQAGAGRDPVRRRQGRAGRRPPHRPRPGDHRDRLRPRFEFLAPELLDSDPDGRPDLHLHAFARKHPTLAVVGLLQPDAGLLPLAHWQSVAVARWLRLRREDPVRAAAVQQKESARPVRSWSRRQVVPTRRHWFEVDHIDYLKAVAGLLREMEPHECTSERGRAAAVRRTGPRRCRRSTREVVSRLVEGEDEPPPCCSSRARSWRLGVRRALAGHAASAVSRVRADPRDGGDLRAHVARRGAGGAVAAAAGGAGRARHGRAGGGAGAGPLSGAGRGPGAPCWTDGGAGRGVASQPVRHAAGVFGGGCADRRQLFSSALPADEADAFLQRMTFHRPANRISPVRAVGDPPVLVVGSPDDPVVPRPALDRTATAYGGAPLLFPGMGHDLMLDAGWAEPIDAILDWLTKPAVSAALAILDWLTKQLSAPR